MISINDNSIHFTCNHVLNKTHPILYITKTDNQFQFLCGQNHSPDDGHIICINDIIKIDKSIKNILKLKDEWQAKRKCISDTWKKSPLYTKLSKKQLSEYIDKTYSSLERKQEKLHDKYNIGQYDSYWYDLETGILEFKNDNKTELKFRFIDIGSLNTKKNSWMWSWANNSTPENQINDSLEFMEIFYETGWNIYKIDYFDCDESLAWEIVATCCSFIDCIGIYRVPYNDLLLFFAITDKI